MFSETTRLSVAAEVQHYTYHDASCGQHKLYYLGYNLLFVRLCDILELNPI